MKIDWEQRNYHYTAAKKTGHCSHGYNSNCVAINHFFIKILKFFFSKQGMYNVIYINISEF